MKYTYDKLVDTLQYYDSKVDGNLSLSKYRELKDDSDPCLNTYVRRFGSWSEAKSEADVGKYECYDKKDAVEALNEVFSNTEYRSLKYYNKNRNEEHPSGNTIRRRLFDGWLDALKEADLDDEYWMYTDDEIESSIKRIYKKINEIPDSSQYKEHRRSNEPSIACIKDEYGRYNKGLQEIGFETSVKRYYDREEIVHILNNLASGNQLSREEYEKKRSSSHPTSKTVIRYFGSWREALGEAGLNSQRFNYTEDEIIDIVGGVCDGDDITEDEFERRRAESHPCVKTVNRRVGWSEAKHRAGVKED